ncbi:cAMP-dependent protein kinase inhibitor alpha-like [Oppia nitens]|uniref:cAMP-dependent protein kinase inhibitor alpha-like n=1 Tax=Oppia nitens TaxID=1686743 RepID=UPI0023DA0322|nr:cAMP-dependent protein kinase inhibitor alpha-like [Oppia nitens]
MDISEPSTSTANIINSGGSGSGGGNCDQTIASGGNQTQVTAESVDDFLNTGRTGRRNAMPDILEEKSCQLSTSDLPQELEKLNFNEIEPNGSSGESSSSTTSSTATTSSSQK